MIHLLPFIAACFLVSSCGKLFSKEEKAEPEPTPLSEDLRVWYTDHINDLDGPPSTTDCDGLLWNSLAYAAGVEIDIDAHEKSPGVYTRRVTHDCYQTGDSRSTISSDMFAGLFAGSYYRGTMDRLVRVSDYGSKNSWLMGEPDKLLGEAYLSINAKAVLGSLVDKDYGKPVWKRVSQDFAKHIQSLLILMELQAKGSASKIERVAEPIANLNKYAGSDPDDYFILAVRAMLTDGDYEPSIRLLLDGTPCPTYVRGNEAEKFCKAHKLFTAKVILEELGE